MVHIGEPEVLERQMFLLLVRVVRRQLPFKDLLEECLDGFRFHDRLRRRMLHREIIICWR